MQLQIVSDNTNSIQKYSENIPSVHIQNQEYKQTIALYETAIHTLDIKDVKELNTSHLSLILEQKPEILIIGTGKTQHFISPILYKDYIQSRIGIECMTNSAACRTYNILLSEQRKVALILII
ncbi:MAG: hypothetical protein RLZZ210_108 [Pseudomonadota bacterium]|jgi:uncharacterized protein